LHAVFVLSRYALFRIIPEKRIPLMNSRGYHPVTLNSTTISGDINGYSENSANPVNPDSDKGEKIAFFFGHIHGMTFQGKNPF